MIGPAVRSSAGVATIAALVVSLPAVARADSMEALDAAQAERFARLALACVHREYPNKIGHHLNGDDDVKPPRELTPAFYGCYDWHSSVHGHWLLARLARLFPDAPFAREARAALAQSLTPAAVAAGRATLGSQGPRSPSSGRHGGLAWLLQLGTELREWPDPEARGWAHAWPRWRPSPPPGSGLAAQARLSDPRDGAFPTAFSFGLALDWARKSGDTALAGLLESRARAYYEKDRDCPLAYEPSGEDFLSPCLAEADLLRRILPPPAFATWLTRFLPRLPAGGAAAWLAPGIVTDRADPKLAHIDGLNLSRAWMLEGIAAGLPPSDRRRGALQAAARAHRDAGLAGVTGEHYEAALAGDLRRLPAHRRGL
jgi:hypothetical protein